MGPRRLALRLPGGLHFLSHRQTRHAPRSPPRSQLRGLALPPDLPLLRNLRPRRQQPMGSRLQRVRPLLHDPLPQFLRRRRHHLRHPQRPLLESGQQRLRSLHFQHRSRLRTRSPQLPPSLRTLRQRRRRRRQTRHHRHLRRPFPHRHTHLPGLKLASTLSKPPLHPQSPRPPDQPPAQCPLRQRLRNHARRRRPRLHPRPALHGRRPPERPRRRRLLHRLVRPAALPFPHRGKMGPLQRSGLSSLMGRFLPAR